MKKFKVGDRVEHRSSVTGSVADVLPSGNYYVRLDRPAFPGDDCMWAFGESELSPLAPIPDGWTPASEPPSDERNVRVTLNDGRKWYGWHSILNWRVFPENADVARIAKNDDSNMGARVSDEVIAWREIEPEPEPEHLYFSEYITINARDEVLSCAHDLKTITELSFVDARNEGEYVGVYRKVGDTSPSGVMGQVEPEQRSAWLVIVESTNDIIDRFSTYEEAFAVACDFTKRYEQAVIRLEE